MPLGAADESLIMVFLEAAQHKHVAVSDKKLQFVQLMLIAKEHTKRQTSNLATGRDSGDGWLPARTVAQQVDHNPTIGAALGKLTSADVAILTLVSWDGVAPAQLADLLELPLPKVVLKHHKARKRFKKALVRQAKMSDKNLLWQLRHGTTDCGLLLSGVDPTATLNAYAMSWESVSELWFHSLPDIAPEDRPHQNFRF